MLELEKLRKVTLADGQVTRKQTTIMEALGIMRLISPEIKDESSRLTREATIRKFLIVQTGGDREVSSGPARGHPVRGGGNGYSNASPLSLRAMQPRSRP